MVRARVLAAATAAGLMVLTGCSKSEDVPVGVTLFGSPPQITQVSVTPLEEQSTSYSCDFTDIMKGFLCQNGYNVQESAPIILSGKYTQVIFRVTVEDPEGIDNVLFAGASYNKPDGKLESTLVLFNDGSENQFEQGQYDQLSGIGQNCVLTPDTCSCAGKIYKVTSNDVQKSDHVFTRAMAYLPNGIPDIARDCIMSSRQQVVSAFTAGTNLSFRIDVVDRDGNLDTWDTKPTVQIADTESSALACSGDECGCCIFRYSIGGAYLYTCGGEPGLYLPDGSSVCDLFTSG